MFPYFEVFGTKVSMMVVGLILALATFILTCYFLAKRNHQDFFKLFYQLPIRVIVIYVLGRYVSVALATSSLIPSSLNDILTILRPHNFDLHFVGIAIAIFIFLASFFSSIKRTENKKIWADILFSAFCNGIIIMGIFLTLGDSFIGKQTTSGFAIRALHPDSSLTKFDGVYPVGLFLSIGALIVSVIFNFCKIFRKKNGLGMRGLLGLLVVINICFLFQNYPRYGLLTLFRTSFDVKQYLSALIFIVGVIVIVRWNRKRFY
ncbi:hypothetical protein FACS1894176_09720 [Bacteroidia bacterium]|nr:hypothetical protein FACS1894176_09720 [Bacteroidia bacterium]